jgi:hypothetical protein
VRFNRSLLGWGLFLVLLGAVPLAVRGGLVSADLAARAWQLWPLLIVAIGLAIVARGTALENVAGLAFPIVFGLMLGGVLARGGIPFGGCSDDQPLTPFATQTGTFGSGASVDLDLGCGQLQVTAVSGDAWQVAGSDRNGDGPRIEASADRLQVRSTDSGPFSKRGRWEVEIPTTPTVTLAASINAGDGRFDLGGATLGSVDLEVNAGSARLDLGIVNAVAGPLSVDVNAGSAVVLLPDQALTGDVSVNAGSVVVCTPPSAGIRITTNDNITSSFDFGARGLVRSGNTWETPGYAEAAVKIELRADANAGSVALDRPQECGTAQPSA